MKSYITKVQGINRDHCESIMNNIIDNGILVRTDRDEVMGLVDSTFKSAEFPTYKASVEMYDDGDVVKHLIVDKHIVLTVIED